MTMILATGENPKTDGARYGALQVFFHAAKSGTFGQATPEPGKAVLFVSTIGLDQILAHPDANNLYLKLSGDPGCTKAIGDDQYTLTGVGPGSSTGFSVAPGAYTAALYAVPNPAADFPACTGTPFVKDIAVTLTADQTTLLEFYGPKETDIRSLVLPFDK